MRKLFLWAFWAHISAISKNWKSFNLQSSCIRLNWKTHVTNLVFHFHSIHLRVCHIVLNVQNELAEEQTFLSSFHNWQPSFTHHHHRRRAHCQHSSSTEEKDGCLSVNIMRFSTHHKLKKILLCRQWGSEHDLPFQPNVMDESDGIHFCNSRLIFLLRKYS